MTGRRPNETSPGQPPQQVRDAQAQETNAVKHWVKGKSV